MFDETIAPLEELFLELSRTYIQIVRDKSSLGSKAEKEVCVYTIYHTLMESLKMFNIIIPFISEAIYLNLQEEFGLEEDSITHFAWPKADGKMIDSKIEEEMEASKEIIQAVLHAREKAKLGLRWPVKEFIVVSKSQTVSKALKSLQEIIST